MPAIAMAALSSNRLRTVLDRLPEGDPQLLAGDLKVSKHLPEGVASKELYSDIIRIAWPSFVELILTQLASMVDLMMVGSIGGEANPTLGAQALTAVGLTTQPKFLLMTAFMAMNTGVTALVARYKGIGDREKANLVVRQGLMFTFFTTIILSILGVIFCPSDGHFHGFDRRACHRLGNPVPADPDGGIYHNGADKYHHSITARRR